MNPTLVRTLPFLHALDERHPPLPTLVWSMILITVLTAPLLLAYPSLHHWFLLPVMACGVVVGLDVVNWFRGRLDPLDPRGILGLFGLHFFFLSALLQIAWEHGMPYVPPLSDWRPWVGQWALWNLGGLLVYRGVLTALPSDDRHPGSSRTHWKVVPDRFINLVIVLSVLTVGLQTWIFMRFGGISGYMSAYENRSGAMEGMGWIFMIAESFPILAMMGLAVYLRHRRVRVTLITVIWILLAFFCIKLLFGGLRGSRSNTVWGVFWAAGIIHCWLRPLSRNMLLAGMVGVVGFLYVYGFFKGGGREALQDLRTGERSVERVERQTGRSLQSTLLGDMSRVNVQSYLLHRMQRPNADYRRAYGRTYLASLSLLIPKAIWKHRPTNKVQEGTDALYGHDTYRLARGKKVSSRVYGLAGEAMLNFGPWAIPCSFLFLGLLVAGLRRAMSSWYPDDTRWLIAPILINLCLVLLVADSDNLLFFFVKNGFLPMVAVYAGSVRSWTNHFPTP